MPDSIPPSLHWDHLRPPPRLILRLSPRLQMATRHPPASIDSGSPDCKFDFSARMHELCEDIAAKVPVLRHVDPERMLFSIIRNRVGTRHGLQARITPLRSAGGSETTVQRTRTYRIQQFYLHGRPTLYVVAFCLPRFLNRDFTDKLVTVIHELYHISPEFDGDLRRHEGRYSAHTASQKKYDAHMAHLAKAYLNNGANQARFGFLQMSFAQICRRHGAIEGLHLPRAKLIRIEG